MEPESLVIGFGLGILFVMTFVKFRNAAEEGGDEPSSPEEANEQLYKMKEEYQDTGRVAGGRKNVSHRWE